MTVLPRLLVLHEVLENIQHAIDPYRQAQFALGIDYAQRQLARFTAAYPERRQHWRVALSSGHAPRASAGDWETAADHSARP
jgi:hypothetical protein